MPKILDQMQNKILESAKKKIFEEGLNNFSLRSIAKDCDIAVGTIYNYFKNKDKLIETILFEDWISSLEKVDVAFENISSIEEGFLIIYRNIREFVNVYTNVWTQFTGSVSVVYSHHALLLEHIQMRILQLMTKFSFEEEKRLSIVLSECVLSCALHVEIDEEEYLYFIKQIFKK